MPRRSKALFLPPEGLVQAFGESRYGQSSGIGQPRELLLQGTRRELRLRLREQCPDGPGVYGFVDRIGVITYVGMSRSLRKRLSTYFSSRSGHRKEFRIGRKCTRLYWQPVAHAFLARLRELELIHKFRPQDNIEGQPSRTSLGYIVQTAADVPSFEVRAEVTRKTRYMWGPVPMGRRTQAAVAELNRAFLLRDCPPSTRMRYLDELPLLEGELGTPCLRADLGTCLAPCVSGCTKQAYTRALGAARKFLNGTDASILDRLGNEMLQAVQGQRFERAARFRDLLSSLEQLDQILRWFHDWIEQATFIYELPSMHDDFEPQAVVVVRGVIREIVAGGGKRRVNSLLTRIKSEAQTYKQSPSQQLGDLPAEHFEVARFLFRWFRRYPDEKHRLKRVKKSPKVA